MARRCFILKKPIFSGVATALVTPFSDGKLDLAAYDCLLETQHDVQALVVTGTTGESPTLTGAEKAALWRHTAQRKHGGCKVIAGVGTNCTADSVRQARIARDCGVDALLAVTPYYNKCTQAGLIEHYSAIADATELPLLLYNVPSRTGVNLLPETCKILSEHPSINGVKEAGGDLKQVAAIRELCGDALNIWSGNDDQTAAVMALGGRGVISVLSNVRPKAAAALTAAAQAGDDATAAALQARYLPLIAALFSEVNPIPVKAALQAMGLCSEELRLPLTPISAGNRAALHAALLACPELTS